jgi:hypothetical protein
VFDRLGDVYIGGLLHRRTPGSKKRISLSSREGHPIEDDGRHA